MNFLIQLHTITEHLKSNNSEKYIFSIKVFAFKQNSNLEKKQKKSDSYQDRQ